jgi:competence protein ComEC
MNKKSTIPVWKAAPFLRLLPALVAGIMLQWYLSFPPRVIFCTVALAFILGSIDRFLLQKPLPVRLLYLSIHLLLMSGGALLVLRADFSKDAHHISQKWKTGDQILFSLSESPVGKNYTWKVLATAESLIRNDSLIPVTGKVILYFKKDSLIPKIGYGTRLLADGDGLEKIISKPNPGGFNYARYCYFNGISHQLTLPDSGYAILPGNGGTRLGHFLNRTQTGLLNVLRNWLPPGDERAVAQALLMGYRTDLDTELIQDYSNTGAIHVIAISGLHLGFIYLLLQLLFKPLEKRKGGIFIKSVITLLVLWLFTLLAGAAPSILRSAFMFSCMLLAPLFQRRNASVYNSLALSAFLLLCINPFYLWDAGFQLSYSAVLSIVIFMKPLYQLVYFKQNWLQQLWKLNAVTLSAQILTAPVVIYHFHQFPNYFLLSNLVAVPLSSLLLAGELLLLLVSFIPFLAKPVSWILLQGLRGLNHFIHWCGSLPGSITDSLPMNLPEAFCLLLILAGGLQLWLTKKKNWLFVALMGLLAFGLLRLTAFYIESKQQKLVVYRAGKYRAIDFIEGRSCFFTGDSLMLENKSLKRFYLHPSRVYFNTREDTIRSLQVIPPFYRFGNKNILLADSNYVFTGLKGKDTIHICVLSKNTGLSPALITRDFFVEKMVADATNSRFRIKNWKKECDSLQIAFYSVSDSGAFVANWGN